MNEIAKAALFVPLAAVTATLVAQDERVRDLRKRLAAWLGD